MPEAHAEIAHRRLGQKPAVLHDKRVVKAELLAHLRNLLGEGIGGHEEQHRVAGQVQHEEDGGQ